ncbi:MAG TPA: PepSY domain-containing protein [Caulobacteraceae bacterium]
MNRIAAAFMGICLAASAVPVAAGAQGRGPDSLGADWRQQQDEARAGVQQRRLIPLNQVIEQIRRGHPGRALDAGAESMGDRPVYRVRWITTDGRRIDFIIDATSGAILSGG